MGIKYLEPEQVGELLATVASRKGIIGKRDSAIVRIMWEAGPRINELLSLTPDAINLETQEIQIRNGKRNKSRTVPWRNERTTQALQDWLAVRPDSDWLFPVVRSPGRRDGTGESTAGQRLHPNSFRASFKRYVGLAGLPTWVSCHTMRHSFAVYMLDKVPLNVLSYLLGHANAGSTAVYLTIRRRDAIDAAKRVKDEY